MKKGFILCLLFLISLLVGKINGSNIEKTTFIYSIKGADTLRLDKYDMPSLTEQKPCIIFVFGGGFAGGERDNEFNVAYLKRLVESGYTAIAIDYRLGMKKAKEARLSNPMDFINLLVGSIDMAVEDLFDATSFVLTNAADWNIPKDKIIANGSSAGAVTVLQAEYSICNKKEISNKLPHDFSYAGIIAFAGAIFSDNGVIKWDNRPSPIQLFHGDADSNVPYNKLEMFNMGLYGSKFIAEQMRQYQYPYYFYDVENASHEVAGDPMVNNINEIKTFIEKYVRKRDSLMIEIKVKEIGKPDLKKDLELQDFIKANYM